LIYHGLRLIGSPSNAMVQFVPLVSDAHKALYYVQ